MFGGPSALADRLGIGVTALYHWPERGIPARHKLRMLEMAEEGGIALPDWFKRSSARLNAEHSGLGSVSSANDA